MSGRAPGSAYLLKPDDQIGVYRVVRPLGAGGMGEVYLVEHQHLRKRYALKILPADISEDADFIDRFRIEARVMADLEHRGIVRVHNFGEDKGRHFLVMDYVEGPDGAPRTLDDELAWGKKLPERVVLDMAIQLCDALEYAHTFAQGAIIHRDLKPGNILIHKAETRTGAPAEAGAADRLSDVRVKIADFGLAKIVGTDYIRAVIDRSTTLTALPSRPLSPDAEVTQVDGTSAGSTMSLLGTYDYMSPEQKVGKVVDARSDIYALGLILYKMLTGHKPEGTYEPPSKSGVSRRWDPIVARCLKREVEARYQDVARLKKDLQTLATPVYRRAAFPVYVTVAASLVTAVLLFALLKPGARDGMVSAPEVSAEDEKLMIPFKVHVRPSGATLRVSQQRTVVVDTVLPRERNNTIRLMPGVYTFRLERPGYRTVVQDIAVGVDQSDAWSATLTEVFGYLHIADAGTYQISILDRSGRRVEHEAPDIQGGVWVYRLPTDQYQVVLARPDYEAQSRTVDIVEERPVHLRVDLTPLPGSLFIASDAGGEIWGRGRLMGRTGEWLRDVPAGRHELQLRRPGYRTIDLTADVPPNGEVRLDAPAWVQLSATLTVAMDIRGGVEIEPKHMPQGGRVRLGDREPQAVELPWTVVLHDVNTPLSVELSVDGYDVSRAETVRLNDGEHRHLSFRLFPRPVQVTVESNVPADIYRFRGEQAARGIRRLVLGRDVPVGRTGEPFALNPFEHYRLTVVAEGYQPSNLEVFLVRPGATDELFRVALKAESGGE